MKKIFCFLLLLLPCFAQQPQTHDVSNPERIVGDNAKWVQGVGPGYWPTAGTGLTLHLTAGTAFCSGAIVTYAGGTLTMTNTTNYIYLNTAASCVPAVKTSAFTSSDIPIAEVVASGGAITTVTDDRSMFFAGGVTASDIQNQAFVYAAGGGTANAQTVTLAPAIGALVAGQYVCWLPTAANSTTTPTLAVSGLTAKTIAKAGGALAANDLLSTAVACAIYDGTNYELQNPQTGGGGGGSSTRTVNIPFDQCTPGQSANGGNSFFTTIVFTNWDAGVWSFLKNTNADIFCSIKIPHNVDASPAALIIFDLSANDSTASHTDVFSTTDAISSSKNLQVGSLSAGSPSTCTFTTTATAYAVTECSITPAATIAADQYLVVKIHQAASNSVTANAVMPPPMLQLVEDF